MNSAIIATQFFSAVILTVIAVSLLLQSEKRTPSTKCFITCLFLSAVVSVVDAISYICDGSADKIFLLFTSNYLAFILGDVISIFFAAYIYHTVNERHPISKTLVYSVGAIGIADIIFQTIGAITRITFTIDENGVFRDERFYPVFFAVQIVVTVIMVAFVIAKRKIIGWNMLTFMCFYFVTPFVSEIITLVNDEINFLCAAITVSLLIIYVGLESGAIAKSKVQEQFMFEILNKDALTGVGSRHAYDSALDAIAENSVMGGSLGVMFCDINNLKYVNDNLGHEKGDAKIKSFAETLTFVVGKSVVYRISGDEFVVLDTDSDEKNFLEQAQEVKDALARRGSLASVGFSFGNSGDFKKLLSEAEEKMYADKDAFYARGEVKRREK